MSYRISPVWWPVIALSSPVLLPMLFIKNGRYKKNIIKSHRINNARMERAQPLEIPQLESFELTVLVEQKVDNGFWGAPGVSYLIKTNLGSLLFDLGFGPDNQVFTHNAKKLGFRVDQVDALVISHLHPDHMGGLKAARKNKVTLPQEIGDADHS